MQAIWTVTGRVWNEETRKHDKLQSIEFTRAVDATGFVSLNRNWIAAMVIDRNEEAMKQDGLIK
jgi:hypothetical protein